MNTFDKIKEPLKELLEVFEWEEYINTGMKMLNLGFARADYDGLDEEKVYITLQWGIAGERTNVEQYSIYVEDLLADVPVREKLRKINEAN